MNHWEIESRRPTTAGRATGGLDPRPLDEVGSSSAATWRTIAAIGVGVPSVYAAIVLVIGLSASPHVPAGQCEGIGFGCTLAPRDSVWLLGTWLGLFVVPALYVVASLIVWASRRASRRGLGAASARSPRRGVSDR